MRPPLPLGRKIDNLGRHRRALVRDPLALGVAFFDVPVAVAEIGTTAVALHARDDRAQMDCRLAVYAPIDIAAAVDALVDPGSFQSPIADSFPLLPDRFDLARSRSETIKLAGFGAEPVGIDLPRRHQHMRVVIPLVAVPVGRVDREIDSHPVPSNQTRGKFVHRCQSLLVAELVRQRQNDVSARCRIVPACRRILGTFGGVPQLGAIPCP